MDKRGRLVRSVLALSALLLSFIVSAVAEPTISEAPKPVTSEFFTTKGGGWVSELDPRNPEKPITYSYFLVYKILKPFPRTVFAEVEFQNPANAKAPCRSEKAIYPDDKELDFRSPAVKGLKSSEIYTVRLRVYADKAKRKFLTEHVQPLQAPSLSQTQTWIALQRGYNPLTCTGMQAIILAPPAWHFKEVGTAETASCFLTKEEIVGQQGRYFTGVAIHRFMNLRADDGQVIRPQELGTLGLKEFIESHKLIRVATRTEGPNPGYEIEFIVPNATPPSHMILIWWANGRPGKAFMITAQSPDVRWREEWPIMEPIIRTIHFDSEK